MTPTKRRQAFLSGMIVVVQTLTFNIDSESLNKKKKKVSHQSPKLFLLFRVKG